MITLRERNDANGLLSKGWLCVLVFAWITLSFPESAVGQDGRFSMWNAWEGARVAPALSVWDEPPVSMDAGLNHIVAALPNGRVVAWGRNDYGKATVPSGLGLVKQVAAGAGFTVALLRDGTVRSWGAYGRDEPMTAPQGLRDVTAVCAGGDFAAALRSDGSVVFWGEDLPQGSPWNRPPPSPMPLFAQIGCGHSHFLGLTTSDEVVAWGSNGSSEATPPAGLSNVVEVKGGLAYSLAREADGTIVTWGYMTPGPDTKARAVEAGFNVFASVSTDGEVVIASGRADDRWQLSEDAEGIRNVVALAAGDGFVVVATREGGVFVIGRTEDGLGRIPVPAGSSGVRGVAGGGGMPRQNGYFAAVKGNGGLAWWGGLRIAKDPQARLLDVPEGLGPVAQVAVGWRHAVARIADGTVRTWGSNEGGRHLDVPAGLNDVIYVAAASDATVAVRRDGTVVAWDGGYGGLLASPPPGLSGVREVSLGSGHALALKADGTVVSWGEEGPARNVPLDLVDVVQVVAGTTFSLALLSDGAVRSWGTREWDTDEEYVVPEEARDLVRLALTDTYVIGCRRDGSVVAWYADGLLPQPEGLTGVAAVASDGTRLMAFQGPLAVSAELVRAPSPAPIRSLYPPGPNPSRGGVIVVRYRLDTPGPVWLDVLDMQGRVVAILERGTERPAGDHSTSWGASSVAPGLYVVRLRLHGKSESERVLVAR